MTQPTANCASGLGLPGRWAERGGGPPSHFVRPCRKRNENYSVELSDGGNNHSSAFDGMPVTFLIAIIRRSDGTFFPRMMREI